MLTFCVHSSWKFLLIPPGEQSWSWISQHESSVSIRKLNKTWRFNCLTNLTEWNLGCFHFAKSSWKVTVASFVVIWQNLSNYGLTRLKRFVPIFTDKLCN
jgi:hypothetical protein